MNQALAVQQLRDRRAELERQLAAAIAPLLDQFRADTGLSPSRVYVNLCEVTRLRDAHPVCVLESVSVTLDL